jgi:hypothetical protein
MPNHVHILMTLPGEVSLEKVIQLIKGGFSFRANKELGFRGEVWQRGFSDVRIVYEQSFEEHRAYIVNNPVKAGLANSAEEFPFGSVFLKKRKNAGAKQAAEKLDFPERVKNRSRQEALGAIREGKLMVFYSSNFALSPFIRSFSAACKAHDL